jgi:F-type H+-transporting ATPase subunit b
LKIHCKLIIDHCKLFMGELINTFHIDWKLIIAQAVNFGIVLFVLWKFAYDPILKTLNDRSQKIEKGIRDAESAGKKLAETEEKEKEVLVAARKEAQVILTKAEDLAKKNKEDLENSAKVQADKIMTDAKAQIEEEKNKMLKEVKAEIGDLIVSATEKIIGEKLDKNKDKDLIEKAIK